MENISINFKIEGVEDASTEIKNLTGDTGKLDKAVNKSEATAKSYAAQIKKVKLDLIELGERTKENAAEFDALTSEVVRLTNEQQNLTIGTQKLENQLAVLPGPIGGIAKSFNQLDAITKNSRAALINLTNQFPILKNAIVATGIGALVVVFGLLVAGVIRAFKTFKPLQQAVENLGVAFGFVGKAVQPLIDLIGKGLTNALNFVGKAIAFVTGNMKEYNAEIEKAAKNKELETKLEEEATRWEIIQDNVNDYTRALRNAYDLKEKRIKEINALQQTQEIKDGLIRDAELAYLRVIDRENKKLAEAKKKRNKLTEEELKQLKELQQIALNRLNLELKRLTAQVVGEPEIKVLQQLQEQFDKINEIVNRSAPSNEKFNKTLADIFGTIGDVGKPILENAIKDIKGLIDNFTFIPEPTQNDLILLENNIQKVINNLTKNTEVFGKKQIESFNKLGDNFQIITELYFNLGKDASIYYDLVQKREIDLTSEQSKSLQQRKIDEEQYNKERIKMVEAYSKVLLKDKEFSKATEEERMKAADAFITQLENAVKFNKEFERGIKTVNIQVENLRNQIADTIREGAALDKFVDENIDNILKIYTDSFGVLNAFVDEGQIKLEMTLGDFRKNLLEILPNLQELSQEELIKLLRKYVDNSIDVYREIDKIQVGFFENNLKRQLYELEERKKADLELLKSRGATEEQMFMVSELYANRKIQLERQTNLMIADMAAQTIANISGFFEEGSAAMKAAKFAEATIVAISSSIRAFEWGLEYGGPLAPKIAPVFAAITFASQMNAARKILAVQDPPDAADRIKSKNASSSNSSTPTYTGYYETGGMIYGRRHKTGGTLIEAEGGEYIINRKSMMVPGVFEMAQSLNNVSNILSNPQAITAATPVVKAYVVSKEMTNQQTADKRIKDLSRL